MWNKSEICNEHMSLYIVDTNAALVYRKAYTKLQSESVAPIRNLICRKQMWIDIDHKVLHQE